MGKSRPDDHFDGDDLFDDFQDEDVFDNIDTDTLLSSPVIARSQKRPTDEDDDQEKHAAPATKRQKSGHTAAHPNLASQRIALAKKILSSAGKSLCYQIPAIAFEEMDLQDGSRSAGEHGIAIVVSPLIALMKDQVDALKKRDIAADCLDSSKSWPEQQVVNAALRDGKLRLLYCAPERLNNEGFVEMIKHVRGGVRLLAVDEAHCISEWGHSFRPDYLKVARLAVEIQAERVVCLTATATPAVAQDVCKAFNISPQGVFRTSPYRPNLSLNAKGVREKMEKYDLIYSFLRKNPGPTLVYVTLQEQAVNLAGDLRSQGFDAKAFHAGMKADEKKAVQDCFMANKVRIVVATIAFGMGIDKPDIRNVIHFDLANSLEEYSQQVGRAGRDGKPSTCMFYLCPEDFYLRENFARGDVPAKESLEGLLHDIFNAEVVDLPVGHVFTQEHYKQTNTFDIRSSPLGTIYAALELQFGLIRAITPEYSEYKFKPRPSYHALVKTEKSPEAKAIFQNAKKAKEWYSINLTEAITTQPGRLSRADLVRKLNQWHETGHLELKASGVRHKYRILKELPRTSAEIDNLTGQLMEDLERREQAALDRSQQVQDLITGNTCYALGLAQHFDRKKFNAILAACCDRDDPRFLARIAFGIKSPRLTKQGLDKQAVFRSMADHQFSCLLAEFTKVCHAAKVKRKA
ncbi:hypothetical protein P8C59_000490 [Phyllachora maydis]|uniref:DNA 3'-5' helicase n=1 Tax=Phyllachora maydis TaxID=1825666 RepID=A0AAD9HXB3_9PEZI|nr:hypothetical protein P8C59_000490 [Phyllachora maydis]